MQCMREVTAKAATYFNTVLPSILWHRYVTTKRQHPNLVTTCRGQFLQALDSSRIFQPSARQHKVNFVHFVHLYLEKRHTLTKANYPGKV